MTEQGLAVITVVHGRHDHLRRQERSLLRGRRPDVRVVVAMDDADVADLVPGAEVVRLGRGTRGLPLAAARNAGADAALAAGARRLVFLDVDVLVDSETLAGYAAAEPDPLAVWCGPVTYLRPEDRPYDPATLPGLHAPHPARPDPGPGAVVGEDRWELFWSLSFALDAEGWRRSGGFDPSYEGYGGEDTDFGQRLAANGMRLRWNGSARGYHQWHPVDSPPLGHREDIVRNAGIFHDRWGWWPMTGWLEQLREMGAVEVVDGRWQVCR
ncbi:glycosyltransferase family 2 protein [Nocardioides mangrovicus]|uniref:Glycosyltransferase family 2 protein n=1 Tax=Nocardioides mangrovicus TaxID=2478913 RepID=A0A3L8P155_9ACTN|nr:galactosyltransferase-related protein [Nocardioides mangrovicus]RLV48642.1 glycosyltransferase family 2 protein [Nocardioides mangrovicus]